MKLDNRTIRLIAVGASVSANCQPCLQVNFSKALETGADGQEIAEAMRIGEMVRQGAASEMGRLATELSKALPVAQGVTGAGCECDPLAGKSSGGKNG